MIVAVEGAADNQAGIAKVKQGLRKSVSGHQVRQPDKDETWVQGMLTGTGKGKKSGVAVVLAAGVFDAGAGRLAEAAFVVDARIEEHYKETIARSARRFASRTSSQRRSRIH